MELIPYLVPGQPITILGGTRGKVVTLGRPEVKKSVGSSPRNGGNLNRVSLTQLRLNINFMLKEVEVISMGRNRTSVALFEQPMKMLKKLERYELGDGDLIGFGAYHHLYQIKFAQSAFDFTTPKKKKKVDVIKKTMVYFSESSSSSEEEQKENTKPMKRRIPCIYGQLCYRRANNVQHANEQSHPGDDDYWDPAVTELPSGEIDPRPHCNYGLLCYQKDQKHIRQFQHTQFSTARPKRKAAPSEVVDYSSDTDGEFKASDTPDEDFSSSSSGEEKDEDPLIKISEAAREHLKETKNLLRKNVF